MCFFIWVWGDLDDVLFGKVRKGLKFDDGDEIVFEFEWVSKVEVEVVVLKDFIFKMEVEKEVILV